MLVRPSFFTEESPSLKLKKLGESFNTLILAHKKIPDSFIIPGTIENKFIEKILQTTLNNSSSQPAEGLGYAINLEIIKGSKPLCSAALDDQHRVQLILRFVPSLKKLVIVLLVDDPGHQYKKLKAKYGSDAHWQEIVSVINEKNYYVGPLAPLAVKEPARKIIEKPAVVTESKEVKNEVPALNEAPTTIETCPVADSAVEKKKKKKKKSQPDTGFLLIEHIVKISTKDTQYTADLIEELFKILNPKNEYFLLALTSLIGSPNGVDIVSALLDVGMNPDIFGEQEGSLLMQAVVFHNFNIAKLLFDRGAGLEFCRQGERFNYLTLCLAVDNINPQITKLIIQKTKEKGDLNAKLIDVNKIPLHYAIANLNVLAVQQLLENGADPMIMDVDYQLNPVQLVMRLNQDANIVEERKPLLKQMLTMLLEFQKTRRVQQEPESKMSCSLNK